MKNDGIIFMDELLTEVELKEGEQTLAYYDLLLLEIQEHQRKMAETFTIARQEIEIINQWAVTSNSKLQDKINFIEKKLEAFIKQQGTKTIDMAHGVLKLRKKPDKVEIKDLQLFLKHAKPEMLTIIPEEVKPDLTKIKSYLKGHYTTPPGIEIITGNEEFTYKLKEEKESGKEEIGINTEPALPNRIAV